VRIKQHTFLTCVGIMVIFAVISYMMSEIVVSRDVDGIESRQAEESMRLLQGCLRAEGAQADRYAAELAFREDVYRFMRDRGGRFAAEYFDTEALVGMRISSASLYSEEGRPVFSQTTAGNDGDDAGQAEERRLCARVANVLLEGAADALSGLLAVDGRIFGLSAHKIRGSVRPRTPAGALVLTRPMDAAFLQRFREVTGLHFAVEPASAFDAVPAVTDSATGYKLVREADAVTVYAVMRDVFGDPVLCLRLDAGRDVAELGRGMGRKNFLLIAAFGLILLLAFLLFTEAHILRRVVSIQRQARRIGRGKGVLRRIVIPGDDEIHDLAMSINRMVGALQSSERFLGAALDTLQAGVVSIDPDTRRILNVNAFARRFLGLPREDIVGRACREVICSRKEGDCPLIAHPDTPVRSLLQINGRQKSLVKSGRAVELNGKKIILETFIDITELEKTRHELSKSEERYRMLFMNTGMASAVVSDKGRILLANTEFAGLVGLPRADIEEKLHLSHFFNEGILCPGDGRFRSVAPGESARCEGRIIGRDGRAIDVMITWAGLDGGRCILSLLDISERKDMETELAYRADHDMLTGLPNKRLLTERLEKAMAAARGTGRMVGVLLVDLDRFKGVNDSFGHTLGDKLLRQAAGRLSALMKLDDCVARTGGDEFLFAVSDVTDRSQLEDLARSIRTSLNRCFYVEDNSIYLGASIGITCFPADGENAETLLRNADLAMYRSKERGKNAYTFFTNELNIDVTSKMTLETALFKAVENEALEAYYQPKVDIVSGRVAGCEALVRWRREDKFVPPPAFIPLAEETGLVTRLDMFMLRSACRQIRVWMEKGCEPVPVAVNMSARTIQSEGFVEKVRRILREEDMRPDQVDLEITETGLMSDLHAASGIISQLSNAGIRIFLDDFGTGYSSLQYLHSMPIACLKIDKKFIDDLNAPEGDSRELVTTIIALATGLGMSTVAEGVERKEQLDFLAENGCRVIQGHIFSKALSGAEFAEFLLHQKERIDAVLRHDDLCRFCPLPSAPAPTA
jgi:diguanylate cyclase (GGDEF)-like protein/PAS domain S-box-containing protein